MHPSRLKDALARTLSLTFPVAWTHYNRTFRKHHFDAEYWLIPLFCRPDGIAVDVGANMGIYAFAMAKHAGQVVAFEPNTDLWPFLRRFLGDRVRLEDAALSGSAGQAEFRVVADNTGVATIEARNPLSMIDRPETIATRTVATRTLDSFRLTRVSRLAWSCCCKPATVAVPVPPATPGRLLVAPVSPVGGTSVR